MSLTENTGATVVENETLTGSFKATTTVNNSDYTIERIQTRANEIMNDRWNFNSAEAYQAAILELHAEMPAMFGWLSNYDRGEIAYRAQGDQGWIVEGIQSWLTDNVLPEGAQEDVMQILMEGYDPAATGDYNRLLATPIYNFQREFSADPILRDARENWDEYSAEERLEVGRRIHDLHARSLGFEPAEIENTDTLLGERMRGAFIRGQDKIYYNTDPDAGHNSLENRGLDEFVSTTIHEGTHVFDWQLGENMLAIKAEEDRWVQNSGITSFPLSGENQQAFNSHMRQWVNDDNNLPNPDLRVDPEHLLQIGNRDIRGHAMMVGLNTEYYVPSHVDDEGYYNNPTEESARFFAARTPGELLLAGAEGELESHFEKMKIIAQESEAILNRNNGTYDVADTKTPAAGANLTS